MIGEIEALLDKSVDVDQPVLAGPRRECSNMFLTIASARLPCCTTLSRLSRKGFRQVVDVGALLFVELERLAKLFLSSSISSTERPRNC